MKTRTKQEKIDLILPFLCAMTYISSYLGRHSYNSNITQIIDAFGISYKDSGVVTTFFFFSYGAGQFIHGMFSSRYNEKYVIPLALGASSAMNLLVFLGVDFAVYKYLWLINGIFLSMLWPTLIRTLSKYLSARALSRGTLLMAGAASTGYCFTYLMSAAFTALGIYEAAFLFAALVMLVLSTVWVIAYYKLGLDTTGVRLDLEAAELAKKPAASAQIVRRGHVLALMLISLGLYAIISNTIKEGLHVWVPSVLRDKFDLPGSLSTFLSLTLSVFGMFASVTAVKFNKVIKNYLLEIELIFVMAGGVILAIIGLLNTDQLVLTLICLGITAWLMHTSCSVITSIAPLELRDSMDSGVLAGILNGCCYVGSVISSYALSIIADNAGWSYVFYFLLALACVPIVMLSVKICIRAAKKIGGHRNG